MASDITFDASDFQNKIGNYLESVLQRKKRVVHDVASEVLRLSQFQVPHDTGLLQNSGHVEDREDESIVGYNKVYAARLHENPQYNFQKGRKGKYLEDPIKTNLRTFLKYFQEMIGGVA